MGNFLPGSLSDSEDESAVAMSEKNDKKDPSAKRCDNCSTLGGSAGALKLSACARCGLVVYCSKACQKAHWRGSHKQYCVPKADQQMPQHQNPALYRKNSTSTAATDGEKCRICLEALSDTSFTTLQCSHTFHETCMVELRKYKLKQVCPLCRAPLPPGPEKQFEEAIRLFIKVHRLIKRGVATWSTRRRSIALELGFSSAKA